MKKFEMFVALCILSMSILACGLETASQPTPVAQNVPSTNTPLIDRPNHEAILLANNFTYSPSKTMKYCSGTCQVYFNEQYNMIVNLDDNGDIAIAFGALSETFDPINQAQGTLMSRLVDEFFGRDALSWVAENLLKSVNHELTADINGYRLFMQVNYDSAVFTLMATPLH
jgi:hypothetical protein